MASVTVDDVRDVINVSSAEVPDAKVTKMIKRAEQGSSTLSAVRSLLHPFGDMKQFLGLSSGRRDDYG